MHESGRVTGAVPQPDHDAAERMMLQSRPLLDLVTEGIVLHDLDGAIYDANEMACTLLGLTREQLLGRTSFDLGWGSTGPDGLPFPGEENPAMVTLRTGLAINDVTIGIDAPGRGRRWLSVSARPLVVDGVVEGVGAMFLDVTDRLEASEALAASEARYRILAEHSSDIVIQSSVGSGVDWVSPSIERVLGWRVDEVLGRSLVDLVADEDVAETLVHRNRVLSGEALGILEMRFKTADGDRRWMSVNAHPLTEASGRVAAVVFGLRDCQAEVIARRAATTLSAGNAILARAVREDELLAEMCQTAVDVGGYTFSWYGRRVDDDVKSVAKVAASQEHREYLDLIEVSWGDDPLGRGPTGVSLRMGSTRIVDDFTLEADFRPWLAAATGKGLRSSISLTVFVDGVIDGAFMVYSAEPHSFDDHAVTLFEDLARQLGYGLKRLRDHELLLRALHDRVLLESAIDQAGEAIVVTDPTPVIVYANPASQQSTGYALAEILGHNPRIFQSGLHDRAFYRAMWSRIRNGQTWSGILLNRRKNGELYEEDTTIAPVHDAAGTLIAYVAVKRDLTVVRRLEADLSREQSDRGAVVQLMGRVRPGTSLEETTSGFLQALTELEGIDAGFVFLVLPDRRIVPVGAVGPVPLGIEVGLPAGLTRDGSDDAAVGASVSTELADALILEGFTATAYAPIRRGNELIGVLAVATRRADGAAVLESRLGILAELGMLADTLFGGQTEIYRNREALRAELEEVLVGSSFRPFFQPVIDLKTAEVVGYEALTRFDDGTRPDLRFAMAQSVGLGPQLEAACASAAIEASKGLPPELWLSLNFSPAAVLDGHAKRTVGCAERPIIIEVTEHVQIEDYPALKQALRECGPIRVSVDDAGAGYASLRHILELEPDIVKLDIGLVRGIDVDPARQALAAGLHHFATLAGTHLVAEGIEHQAEADMLIDLGVHFGQGYLFGRPAPLD